MPATAPADALPLAGHFTHDPNWRTDQEEANTAVTITETVSLRYHHRDAEASPPPPHALAQSIRRRTDCTPASRSPAHTSIDCRSHRADTPVGWGTCRTACRQTRVPPSSLVSPRCPPAASARRQRSLRLRDLWTSSSVVIVVASTHSTAALLCGLVNIASRTVRTHDSAVCVVDHRKLSGRTPDERPRYGRRVSLCSVQHRLDLQQELCRSR